MNRMEDKISVIIPVYNCELWIGRCLDSVIGQTYQNIEIIAIDDGSTDGSAKILEEYVGKDKRVHFFSQTNQGVSSARNRGLMQAMGSMVTFVDADDYIEKDMYERMVSAMTEQDADIVECSCRWVEPSGKILRNIVLQEESVDGKRQCVRHYLRQENVRNYVWNKIFRRELFDGLSFPSLKYSEDYYINAILHARAEKKLILSDLFYHYVLYEGQTTDSSRVSLSNFDGVKAGRLVAGYFRKDRELRTYAAVYACDYAIRTTKQYLRRYPKRWEEVRKRIRADFWYCYFHMAAVGETGIDVAAKKREYRRFFRKGEIGKEKTC